MAYSWVTGTTAPSASLDRPAADSAHAELAAVYRDHGRAVYGVARRVCGSALAADVTQEVFLGHWRHPDRFDPARGSLRNFLLTITRRRAVDALRSENARRRREARTSEGIAVPAEGDSRLMDQERAAEIARAMEHLTPLERQAVVAAYYGDRTYSEVAENLGVPLGTIKSRIRSGLAKLHATLGEPGRRTQDEAA